MAAGDHVSQGTFELSAASDDDSTVSVTVTDASISSTTYKVALTPKGSPGANKSSTLLTGAPYVYVSAKNNGSFVVKADPAGVPETAVEYDYIIFE